MTKTATILAPALVAGTLALTGCSTVGGSTQITAAQMQVAGEVAALAWAAGANPTATQQAEVSAALAGVSAVAASTNAATLTAAVLPAAQQTIAHDEHIPAADKPLVASGVALLLGAADAYAAAHSQQFANMADKLALLAAFVQGAQAALPTAK